MKATSPTGKSSDSVLNWQKLLSCTEISWKEVKYFHFKISLWNIFKISNLIQVYVMYNYMIGQMPNTIVNMMSQKKKRDKYMYKRLCLWCTVYTNHCTLTVAWYTKGTELCENCFWRVITPWDPQAYLLMKSSRLWVLNLLIFLHK